MQKLCINENESVKMFFNMIYEEAPNTKTVRIDYSILRASSLMDA